MSSYKLGMLIHACNSSAQVTEAGGPWVWDCLDLYSEACLTKPTTNLQERRHRIENTVDTMHTRNRHQNGRYNARLISNILDSKQTDGSNGKAEYGKTSLGKLQNPAACYLL